MGNTRYGGAAAFFWSVGGAEESAPTKKRLLQRGVDHGLGFLEHLCQVVLAAEALAVDLVDILGARRPGCEPGLVGHHLDAADGLPVSLVHHRDDGIAR